MKIEFAIEQTSRDDPLSSEDKVPEFAQDQSDGERRRRHERGPVESPAERASQLLISYGVRGAEVDWTRNLRLLDQKKQRPSPSPGDGSS